MVKRLCNNSHVLRYALEGISAGGIGKGDSIFSCTCNGSSGKYYGTGIRNPHKVLFFTAVSSYLHRKGQYIGPGVQRANHELPYELELYYMLKIIGVEGVIGVEGFM